MPNKRLQIEIPPKENKTKISTKKHVKGREYYEETLEREQHERHVIATKQFCEAKKNYTNFQKHLKNINDTNLKNISSPDWYQELSPRQEEILSQFDGYMKNDIDMDVTKNTKRALKNLGVRTFIPHVVVMEALYDSKLYPVSFLLAIKNYVLRKDGQTCDGTNELPCQSYTLDQRLLMSSILHMEFPLLLKKLDYCLSPRVPDKDLEYKSLKIQKPAVNYSSPYLEPLPIPIKSWPEIRDIKLHNLNVKLQKRRKIEENKNALLRQQREMDIEKKTTLKMRVTYPIHPLMKMFYKPPILEMFKDKTAQQEIQTVRLMSTAKKVTDGDRRTTTTKDGDRKTTTDGHRRTAETERAGNKPGAAATKDLSSRLADSRTTVTFASENNDNCDDGDSDKNDSENHHWNKPHGWLMADHSVSNVSAFSSADSLTDGDDPTQIDANNTQVVIDFDDSSVDIQPDCRGPSTNARDEGRIDVPVPADDPNTITYLGQQIQPEMDIDEKTVWQMFKKHGGGGGAEKRCPNRRYRQHRRQEEARGRGPANRYFSKSFVAVDTADRNTSMVGMPVTPPSTVVMQNDEYDGVNYGSEDGYEMFGDEYDTTDGGRDGENYGFDGFGGTGGRAKPTGWPSMDDRNSSVSGSLWDENDGGEHDEEQDELPEDEIETEQLSESETVDDVLIELQKLPPWKQLKAVLKFLAALGDPVAGFQGVIQVNKLRRWYEKRINVNRHMTPRIKNRLLNESIALWQMERTKMYDVKVPNNPYLNNNKKTPKFTWDDVHDVKKKLKETKSQYTKNLKHISVDNTRKIYATTRNEYHSGVLGKRFKQTFYDYFPGKEDDCLFDYPVVNFLKK